MSHEAGQDDDRAIMPPRRSGDQFPGVSGNIMATFYRDELRTAPRRRTWPLLLFPAGFVVFIAVMAYLALGR